MMLRVDRGISQQAMDVVWIKETVVEDRLRRLSDTGHFTFLSELTKPAVTVVSVSAFD